MKTPIKWVGGVTLSAALLLAGCNETQDNTVETEPNDASPVENTELVTPNDYGFTQFDLNIDTPDEDDVIDVDYESQTSGTEIEYTNKLEDLKIGGDEAGTELDVIFAQFELTADMAKEDVIEAVTSAFGVSEYKEFELEVEFEDGTEVQWEESK